MDIHFMGANHKESDITSKTGKMIVIHVLDSAGLENYTNDME